MGCRMEKRQVTILEYFCNHTRSNADTCQYRKPWNTDGPKFCKFLFLEESKSYCSCHEAHLVAFGKEFIDDTGR